jgi:hypothetical protein
MQNPRLPITILEAEWFQNYVTKITNLSLESPLLQLGPSYESYPFKGPLGIVQLLKSLKPCTSMYWKSCVRSAHGFRKTFETTQFGYEAPTQIGLSVHVKRRSNGRVKEGLRAGPSHEIRNTRGPPETGNEAPKRFDQGRRKGGSG